MSPRKAAKAAKAPAPSPSDDDPTLDAPLDHDAEDDADNDTSAEGNVTRAKRDLIKLGLSQGFITSDQLHAALPLAHMSDAEIETLFFTFATLGIQAPKRHTP